MNDLIMKILLLPFYSTTFSCVINYWRHDILRTMGEVSDKQ